MSVILGAVSGPIWACNGGKGVLANSSDVFREGNFGRRICVNHAKEADH